MLYYLLRATKRVLVIAALSASIVLINFNSIYAASLRAGVAKIDVTKNPSTALVNDPLYVKALVLDDGKTKAVIVTLDVVLVENDFVDETRARIQKQLKIDGNNVLINASHNHHVNGQLAEDCMEKTVQAVKEAYRNMVQVKIGAGTGIENRITMNRRLKLKNGKEWTIRRGTPSPPDENVIGVAETFDPEIGILRVDRLDGKPLAVVYNFTGHPYSGVPNKGATACFPGFASRTIENNLGNGVIALFLQGAVGDVTPILYKDGNAPRHSERFGTLLGLSTLDALKNIPVKKKAGIQIIRESIKLPIRTDIPERIDSLKARKKLILDYFKGEGCGSHGGGTKLNFKSFLSLYMKYMMFPQSPSYYSYRYMQEENIGTEDLKMMDAINRRDIEKYLSNIYKMEELIKIEANLRFLEEEIPQNPLTVEVMGMKIGEYVLITFPGEAFSQIGLNIKNRSPFENTFVCGCTNGFITGDYAPTSDAYDGEAYEVSCSKLAPEWQEIYENKVMLILNKLK